MSACAPCVFCDIRAGRAPAHHLLADDLSFAILDINPLAEGHCLVLPRRHVPWWHELSAAETASLFALAQAVARRMMRVFHPELVTLYVRGRRVPHTHIFLVPTRSGDLHDRHFNELERLQETSPELAPLRAEPALADAARRLREAG